MVLVLVGPLYWLIVVLSLQSSQLPAAEQMISALPDVKKIELTDADDFMVLACDGIWNFMSSEAVVKFVKARLDKGETKLSKVCEEVSGIIGPVLNLRMLIVLSLSLFSSLTTAWQRTRAATEQDATT